MQYVLGLILTGVFASMVSLGLALGFQVVFYVTRIFHFAYAGLYTAAGYLAYEAMNTLHIQPVLGIVLAIVGVLILTAAVELFIYRPLRRRGAGQLGILVASLGVLTVLESLQAIWWGNEPLQIHNISAIVSGSVNIFGVAIARMQIIEFVIDLVSLAVLLVVFFKTRIGTKMRAVADAPDRASAFGVNVNRMILVALLLGTLVVAPIAIVEGMYSGLTPYGTEDALLIATVAAFAGGIGSFEGTFIVSVLAGVVTGLSVRVISNQWSTVLLYGILTALVLIRPRGILGRVTRAEGV